MLELSRRRQRGCLLDLTVTIRMKTRRKKRKRRNGRRRLNPRKMHQQRRYRRRHHHPHRQKIRRPARRRGNEMATMNIISTATAPQALPRARDNIDRHLQRSPHGRPVIPVSSRVETHTTTWGKSKSMANDDRQVSERQSLCVLLSFFFLALIVVVVVH